MNDHGRPGNTSHLVANGDSSMNSQGGGTMQGNSELPNSSLHNYTYEELSNGFSCPTCQGTGKIPRGREDDLVALIPYNDARLKPRRTCLYVLISIFVCASIAGILVAFLLPRSISLSPQGKVETVASAYNATAPLLQLTLMLDFEVYNDNFVPISSQSLSVQSSWSDQVIGSNVTWLNSTLGGRHQAEFSANVTVAFTEKVLVDHCIDKSEATHFVYVQFTATLQYGLMSQNQQATIVFYKIVDCEPIQSGDMSG